jgi:hypothetical protein
LYNAFSYPTKISPEAIAVFIANHTEPGAAVLDTFAGSGTSGLATLLCDKPTPAMLELAKEMGVTPKWGARKAHSNTHGRRLAISAETAQIVDPVMVSAQGSPYFPVDA